jgi:hypothetical protein
MGIGSFYNAKGVKTGQAMGLYAAIDSALPGDSIIPFDESVWSIYTVGVGAASAGTFALTISDGPLPLPVTTAGIVFGATTTQVKSAIEAVLPAGYVATVTGTAPTWKFSIAGPGASEFGIIGVGTGLTGGGFTQVVPVWSPFGGTEQGWSLNYTPNVQNINIEEQATAVDVELTDATFQFTANLAENKLKSLQLSMSGDIAVVAAGAGVYGSRSLTLKSELPRMAVCLETTNYKGTVRRHYVPEMAAQANIAQAFRRSAAMQMIPVTFTSTCAPELIQIKDILAIPTS